jgi:Domain of unknown function (DUF4338)
VAGGGENSSILFGTLRRFSATLGSVNEPGLVQGRRIGTSELEQVRQWLAEHPDWSRHRLSRQLARVHAAAEAQGTSVGTGAAVAITEVSTPPGMAQRPLFEHLLQQYHYLSHRSWVGENLQFLVQDSRGQPVACVLFGAPAWQCADRDHAIG